MEDQPVDQPLSSRKGIPDETSVAWRQGFLAALSWISPTAPTDDKAFLERGNSKIGRRSKYYDAMFVWNLPAVATCPGTSRWCRSYCYNADPRRDVFPIDTWSRNWGAFVDSPEKLKQGIASEIGSVEGKVGVRIHSSGDFFSTSYIDFWIDIVTQLPKAEFWAYTRSWVVEELRDGLERLRQNKNIELFASWDNYMPEPPVDWRRSIVVTSESEMQTRGIICPEQTGAVPNCASCRYCMQRGRGDVFFIVY